MSKRNKVSSNITFIDINYSYLHFFFVIFNARILGLSPRPAEIEVKEAIVPKPTKTKPALVPYISDDLRKPSFQSLYKLQSIRDNISNSNCFHKSPSQIPHMKPLNKNETSFNSNGKYYIPQSQTSRNSNDKKSYRNSNNSDEQYFDDPKLKPFQKYSFDHQIAEPNIFSPETYSDKTHSSSALLYQYHNKNQEYVMKMIKDLYLECYWINKENPTTNKPKSEEEGLSSASLRDHIRCQWEQVLLLT